MSKIEADLTSLKKAVFAGFTLSLTASALGLTCPSRADGRRAMPVVADSISVARPTSTLLICTNASNRVSLALDWAGRYNISYKTDDRDIRFDGLTSAKEYTNVSSQEPSLFLQFRKDRMSVQVFLDTVITGEHSSTTTVSLRVNGQVLGSVQCSAVLSTPSIRLQGKRTGLPTVNIWQLGYEGIARSVTDYDEKEFGSWL